ncbi:hypothetical protein MFLAVUS_000748 [Mucor flavus]|uniref:Uncharacterized protein n=1 Tax=Mucor flavus TaxID=439312 RepID=A0ABP9YKM3_9FUNG
MIKILNLPREDTDLLKPYASTTKRERETVSTSDHDRLTRIGNRSFKILQTFQGISVLTVLAVHKHKRIDKMSVANFNEPAAHLEGEVRDDGVAIQEIMRVKFDPRLYNYYGALFPQDVALTLFNSTILNL